MQTLIIGGGLSGLALAEQLDARGHDYLLIEARDRLGGRILSQQVSSGHFDLGPAWFWPGQPRIAALINRLGLVPFEQYVDGILTFEDADGRVQRGRGHASMQGSLRVSGGFGALIDTLVDRLPATRIRCNAQAIALRNTADGITVTLGSGEMLTAKQVVLALPPRVATALDFAPALGGEANSAMQDIPTWMAGQAKTVAVYDTPFWRDAGWSGDAMSHKGPMVEIHDASSGDGGPYALFGFIGVPSDGRADEQALRQHLLAQLVRLFGPKAANVDQLLVKDWAFDPYTATYSDRAPLYAHPTYGMPVALANLWQGRLLFSGTEVAPQFGGYLEGALEAAENTLKALQL